MPKPTYDALECKIQHLEKEIALVRRKEREKAIRELKWQWQTTFDAVGASICVLDADWNIVQCNKATLDLLGAPADEIIGRKCFELVHGTSQPPEVCPVHQLLLTKKRGVEVLKFRGKWIEVAADPILDEEDNLKGIVHIISDITEHKETVDSLKKGESTLRSIFSAVPTGIGMVVDRIIVQANDRLCEMTGYSQAELIGQSIRILYPTDEDFEYVSAEKISPISPFGTRTIETRWQRRDGSMIDVLLGGSPLNREDFSEGITITALDITERKHIEEDLLRSEQRFRALAELLPQTVFEMDHNGYLTFINKNALKVFGFTREDFSQGLYALDMIAADDRKRIHSRLDAILKGTDNIEGRKFTALRKNGKTFPVLVYTATSTDEQGATGLRGIMIDISEQEKLSQEKDQLEEQYMQAQKMEAVGRLAGGVAHDLNNMLSPIVGYSELLLDAMAPEGPNRQAISQIFKAGQRAKDMVRQLLAFSRKQALDIRSVNLQQVLVGFEGLLDRILREDIKLDLKFPKGTYHILADAGQIEQVVMNLAVNAQDAMPGGGKITIAVDVADVDDEVFNQAEVAPGQYVVLTFNDTGHGMDSQTQERIFDPFFTTKGKGQGTGLGLATVYGIVKQHNGSIKVFSEPGQGTQFRIYFPVAQSPSKSTSPKATSLEHFGGTERILLVEDNDAVRGLADRVLKRHGYRTMPVSGGRECLNLLFQRPIIDLLLTDVVLEDTNGKELYFKVKSLYPRIKVIYMSGYTEDVIVHHGVLEEGISFIQKPFSIQELLKKVRGALDNG